MSNPVFTDVVFVGDKREVRSLYGKMKRFETEGDDWGVSHQRC